MADELKVYSCPTCQRSLGKKGRPTMRRPSLETMERWLDEGYAKATDGCIVEPDGVCPHGHLSWLLLAGLI